MIAVGRVALLARSTSVDVTGSAAVSEADDISTASGLETITGTADTTEANDTSTASGLVGVLVELLTDNVSATDATSYTTASITPVANSILLVCAGTEMGGGTAPRVSVSGLGLTWAQVTGAESGTGTRYRTMWWAQCGPTPGSGTLTLTMVDGGSGTTAIGAGWSVLQVTGHATPNPFLQTGSGNSGAVTTLTIPLNDAASTYNAAVSWWQINANEAITHRTNWTELTDRGHTTPTVAYETQWRPSGFGNDDASASWTTSVGVGGVAVEIAIVGSVIGTSSTSEANDTSSAAGIVAPPVTGTAAVTEANDTCNATGETNTNVPITAADYGQAIRIHDPVAVRFSDPIAVRVRDPQRVRIRQGVS